MVPSECLRLIEARLTLHRLHTGTCKSCVTYFVVVGVGLNIKMYVTCHMMCQCKIYLESDNGSHKNDKITGEIRFFSILSRKLFRFPDTLCNFQKVGQIPDNWQPYLTAN